MENVNVDSINKRISRLDKKLDIIVGYLEDITMTPREYAEYLKVQKAHEKGEHRKWKTAASLLEG
jgi:hypothetical protein